MAEPLNQFPCPRCGCKVESDSTYCATCEQYLNNPLKLHKVSKKKSLKDLFLPFLLLLGVLLLGTATYLKSDSPFVAQIKEKADEQTFRSYCRDIHEEREAESYCEEKSLKYLLYERPKDIQEYKVMLHRELRRNWVIPDEDLYDPIILTFDILPNGNIENLHRTKSKSQIANIAADFVLRHHYFKPLPKNFQGKKLSVRFVLDKNFSGRPTPGWKPPKNFFGSVN